MQLVITGGQRPQQNPVKIDWELKAAKVPFDNVQDLCAEYAIGTINGGNEARIEVVAYNLAVIDINSVVKESKANLAIILANGLDQNKASIGYRMFVNNKISKREQISSTNLTWSKMEGGQRGNVIFDVPSGAVLHCFANYADETHHFYWVRDPSTVQNPRRAVHQIFDEKLDILIELLTVPTKGRDARDFESAIAWILWMLGFSVTHLGGTPKTSDALDLVATTPKGHFLLIECTTGILKADKIANLIDRAEKVRQGLINSGNGLLKVLPVLVTNKTREEVRVDAEQAEKSGILVVTREGFSELINLTHINHDPDQLYKQAEGKMQRIQHPSPFGILTQ
jgi:Holliday junction resolvase